MIAHPDPDPIESARRWWSVEVSPRQGVWEQVAIIKGFSAAIAWESYWARFGIPVRITGGVKR